MMDDNRDEQAAAETSSPRYFGKYEVLRTIGKGKFAIVYRAKKIDDESVVALKRISVDMMNDKAREKCLKEVRLLQTLDHTNIIRYIDSFITDNDLMIVYEWAAAGDLKRQLRKAQDRGVGFDERIIWKYFSQICSAIQHMHDKRIMHRDLKPANIFLTLDGTIKVGDLGLSRELSEHTMQAHSKVGTPLYMSPEVLKGEGYDFKSDIWSMGCLLYELAMLKSPFKSEGLNLYSLFQKISSGDYQPLPDDYSDTLRSLTYSMMATRSEDRPEIGYVCKVSAEMRQLTSDKSWKRNKMNGTITNGVVPDHGTTVGPTEANIDTAITSDGAAVVNTDATRNAVKSASKRIDVDAKGTIDEADRAPPSRMAAKRGIQPQVEQRDSASRSGFNIEQVDYGVVDRDDGRSVVRPTHSAQPRKDESTDDEQEATIGFVQKNHRHYDEIQVDRKPGSIDRNERIRSGSDEVRTDQARLIRAAVEEDKSSTTQHPDIRRRDIAGPYSSTVEVESRWQQEAAAKSEDRGSIRQPQHIPHTIIYSRNKSSGEVNQPLSKSETTNSIGKTAGSNQIRKVKADNGTSKPSDSIDVNGTIKGRRGNDRAEPSLESLLDAESKKELLSTTTRNEPNDKKTADQLRNSSLAFAIMDLLYDKLRVLDYPMEDPDIQLKSRDKLSKGRLLPMHFACDLQLFPSVAGHDTGHQFLQFRRMTHVAKWLCQESKNNQAVQIIGKIELGEDTPMTVAKQLLRASQVLSNASIPMSNISPTSLIEGYGVSVCNLLMFFADHALAGRNHINRPLVYHGNNHEFLDLIREDSPSEVGEDDVLDEEQSNFSDDDVDGSRQGEVRSRRVLSKCTTTEDEDTWMGQSAIDNNDVRSGIIRATIDPVLWQQETERVASKLQLRGGGGGSGVEWVGHLQQLKDYGIALHKNNHHVKEEQSVIVTHRSNAHIEISSLVRDITATKTAVSDMIGKIRHNELSFNRNDTVSLSSLHYSTVKKELAIKETQAESTTSAIGVCSARLHVLQEKVDDVNSLLEASDASKNGSSSSGRVVQLKDAIKALKKQILDMNIETALLNHALINCRCEAMKASLSKHSTHRRKKLLSSSHRPSLSDDEISVVT